LAARRIPGPRAAAPPARTPREPPLVVGLAARPSQLVPRAAEVQARFTASAPSRRERRPVANTASSRTPASGTLGRPQPYSSRRVPVNRGGPVADRRARPLAHAVLRARAVPG